SCKNEPITTPSPVSDGCCPASGNANNDADCEPDCGNGVPESGEQCDDGNSNNNDDCTNDCTIPAKPPTGYKVKTLKIFAPHVFIPSFGCFDGTDFVNNLLVQNMEADSTPADGFLDIAPVVVFKPLKQDDGASITAALDFAKCTSPLSSTTCSGGDKQYS